MTVTPCVGVWIETKEKLFFLDSTMSHPAWVCGLKHLLRIGTPVHAVTPCVGVWIETLQLISNALALAVTPCVGVWIETQ